MKKKMKWFYVLFRWEKREKKYENFLSKLFYKVFFLIWLNEWIKYVYIK